MTAHVYRKTMKELSAVLESLVRIGSNDDALRCVIFMAALIVEHGVSVNVSALTDPLSRYADKKQQRR